MPLELWLAYVALCFLFAVTPGPAVILTSGQAVARGFRAGFGVVLGTQLGNLVYFFLSAAGLGAILVTSEAAFTIIKYAGAAYLIFLGVHTIRHARKTAEAAADAPLPLWSHPFMQGLLNQLANPKSILFWGALFPQFVDFRGGDITSSSPSWQQPGSLRTSSCCRPMPRLQHAEAGSWPPGRLRYGGSGSPGRRS